MIRQPSSYFMNVAVLDIVAGGVALPTYDGTGFSPNGVSLLFTVYSARADLDLSSSVIPVIAPKSSVDATTPTILTFPD